MYAMRTTPPLKDVYGKSDSAAPFAIQLTMATLAARSLRVNPTIAVYAIAYSDGKGTSASTFVSPATAAGTMVGGGSLTFSAIRSAFERTAVGRTRACTFGAKLALAACSTHSNEKTQRMLRRYMKVRGNSV
jgi:hypothetical protein